MALAALATEDDLLARGLEPDDATIFMLDVASALVREAAGRVPISETTSTVTLWLLESSQWLPLPGQPIQSVSAVAVEGEVVTGFKLVHGRLWLPRMFVVCEEPLEVSVTMVHGLPEVPENIKQLVVDLALLGAATAAQGAVDPRVVTESVDDYTVSFSQGGAAVASAMTVPELTRLGLRRQFAA